MTTYFANNIPTPTVTPNNEVVGGWVGDQFDRFNGWTDVQLQKLGETITTGLYNGFIAIMDTIIDFVFVTSEIGIICCAIVYIASKDNKSISLGWKLALLYFVAAVVKNHL